MGGGTLLIPLVTIILKVPQKLAQGLNLLSFLPMAIVSLAIHIKNKLVKFKVGLLIISTGIITSICSAIIANKLNGVVLRKVFGIFLLCIGVYQAVCTIRMFYNSSNNKDSNIQYKINFWCK